MNLDKRRSIYALGSKEVLSKDKVVEIVEQSVKHCPTAFNSQSSRALVLFGKHHEKFWNIALEALKKVTPPARFSDTETKINTCFKSGYGTVLFFEDFAVIEGLQKQFPLYKDNFPKWSDHASGMLQFAVWTGLAENNVGATLQHYSPLVDEAAYKEWNIPKTWKLIAQMPFGSIEKPADKKEFSPIKDRVKVFR